MEGLLFALALEVVLLQMRILEGTTEQRARKQHEYKPQKAQRHKFERDRQTIKDVISRTLVEIVENGEYSSLQQAVDVLHKHASYPVKLRSDYDHIGHSRAMIVNELTVKKSQWVQELHSADRKIAILRDKMKDDLQNANARLCYVEKWLFARHESLELQLESVPRAAPPRFDHEDRVHMELMKAYELQIQEREESLQYWRQRYVSDTANIEERLSTKCEQLRVAIARREELQKLGGRRFPSPPEQTTPRTASLFVTTAVATQSKRLAFDLHTGEMRAWLTFKSERAARLAREKRLRDAATRLQSWWRGVMVQKALGSFRYLKNLKKTPTKKKK